MSSMTSTSRSSRSTPGNSAATRISVSVSLTFICGVIRAVATAGSSMVGNAEGCSKPSKSRFMSRLSDINGLKPVSPLGRARDGVKALRAMLNLLDRESPLSLRGGAALTALLLTRRPGIRHDVDQCDQNPRLDKPDPGKLQQRPRDRRQA